MQLVKKVDKSRKQKRTRREVVGAERRLHYGGPRKPRPFVIFLHKHQFNFVRNIKTASQHCLSVTALATRSREASSALSSTPIRASTLPPTCSPNRHTTCTYPSQSTTSIPSPLSPTSLPIRHHAPQRCQHSHQPHPSPIRQKAQDPTPRPHRSQSMHGTHVRRSKYAKATLSPSHTLTHCLDCWASTSSTTQASNTSTSAFSCAALEQALRECMDFSRKPPSQKSTINYHLQRLYPNIRGKTKKKGSLG